MGIKWEGWKWMVQFLRNPQRFIISFHFIDGIHVGIQDVRWCTRQVHLLPTLGRLSEWNLNKSCAAQLACLLADSVSKTCRYQTNSTYILYIYYRHTLKMCVFFFTMLGILYVFVVSLLGNTFLGGRVLNGDKNSTPLWSCNGQTEGGGGGGCSSRTEANGTKRRVNYFVKHPGIKVRPAVVFFSWFLLVSSWWWLVWCWGVPEYACIVVCRSSVGFRWILSSFDCFQYLCVMMHAVIHANSNRHFNSLQSFLLLMEESCTSWDVSNPVL